MKITLRGILVLVSLIAAIGLALLLPSDILRHQADPAIQPVQVPARGPSAEADPFIVPGVPASVPIFLENGQAWRAARVLRDHLRQPENRSPEAILLAATAEAGWGGWPRVREYLEQVSWLGEVRDGEGWYLLARAREEAEAWEQAYEAYQQFLSTPAASTDPDAARVALLRQGILLIHLDRTEEAARALSGVSQEAPAIADRIDILAAEALATLGDTTGVRTRLISSAGDGDASLRTRGQRALLRAYEANDDAAGALAYARRFQTEAASDSDHSWFAHFAGRMAHELGEIELARGELRTALTAAPASAAAGSAATLLEEIGGLTVADRLALARTLDARGANGRAATHYRAWLAAETGSDAERARVRQAMGQALFDAGDFAAAIAAVAPLQTADALYLTGRAEFRRGNSTRGREIYRRVAREFPGSRAGSEALFLVADLAHDDQDMATARPAYREVADNFEGRDRAGLSLMRLAGSFFQQGDYPSAAATWQEYRESYPTGERWLEATYWAGRAHEAAGESALAADLYQAARDREPLSYYALKSSERLGLPFWPPPMSESPPVDGAAEARVDGWLAPVDLLLEAGLYSEAEAEADRVIARAGDDRSLLYPLAERLNERGLTVRGIRIGLRLQNAGDRSPRLLRIVYPFPYRPMVEAEASEKGLDPFLVAALIRQESLFKARISSPAGARGLMQVMPETGRGLARGAGIDGWDVELLFQPEINAHLGTTFLAEQMRRWDGSLPSVFSAYNAGPNRIQAWQRFPEYEDEELFTERIPYRETRDYVKILTRNIAVYRGLYGDGTGGVSGGPERISSLAP